MSALPSPIALRAFEAAARHLSFTRSAVELGVTQAAVSHQVKALESDLKTFGKDHPNVAIRWNNLGGAWHSKGEYDKAIELFEKALNSDLKTFGENHPSVARDWNNIGLSWDSKGEYGKAIGFFEKALAVCRKKLGDDHPHTKLVENNLRIARAEKK